MREPRTRDDGPGGQEADAAHAHAHPLPRDGPGQACAWLSASLSRIDYAQQGYFPSWPCVVRERRTPTPLLRRLNHQLVKQGPKPMPDLRLLALETTSAEEKLPQDSRRWWFHLCANIMIRHAVLSVMSLSLRSSIL